MRSTRAASSIRSSGIAGKTSSRDGSVTFTMGGLAPKDVPRYIPDSYPSEQIFSKPRIHTAQPRPVHTPHHASWRTHRVRDIRGVSATLENCALSTGWVPEMVATAHFSGVVDKAHH